MGGIGASTLNRRAFLVAGASSLAALGAVPLLRAQGAVGVRRSIRTMRANDPDLAAYRRAVAAMKALPSTDPRNWYRFADIHREHCPHSNWYFLPWHRAYLAALEGICRELSGKADFALPYWDWTVQRAVPPAFAAGDRRSNPLNHPRPGLQRGAELDDDMVGLPVISRIMQSPDFEAFGSTRPFGQDGADPRWQRVEGAKTELEFNPHDGVHIALGGDMTNVLLAARDPLFFLHHANVDRLWAEWNRRGNANSADPMWRDFVFENNFSHPDGSPWNVAVGDLGATPPLGYRYDDEGPFAADVTIPRGDPAVARLRAYREFGQSLLACAGAGARGEIPLASGASIRVATAESRQVASRDRPIGISVPLGGPLGAFASASGTRPGRRDAGQRYVWAVLCGIESPPDLTTRVRVFCGGDSGGRPTPMRISDPGYVTSFGFFGHGHGAHAQHRGAGGSAICVDLTSALARMDRGQRSELLPTCKSTAPNAADVRLRRVDIVVI
jgi:tyrosinase